MPHALPAPLPRERSEGESCRNGIDGQRGREWELSQWFQGGCIVWNSFHVPGAGTVEERSIVEAVRAVMGAKVSRPADLIGGGRLAMQLVRYACRGTCSDSCVSISNMIFLAPRALCPTRNLRSLRKQPPLADSWVNIATVRRFTGLACCCEKAWEHGASTSLLWRSLHRRSATGCA